MKARATVRVTDMDAFADALCSGDFPSEGLTDFIEISTDGTVRFRGEAAAVATVLSYLSDLDVLEKESSTARRGDFDGPPAAVVAAAKALPAKVVPGWQ